MYSRRLSPRSESPDPQRRNGVTLYDAPVYPHTSTFRSPNLELSVRSPRVEQVEDQKFVGQSIPVFGGKDSVGGTVTATLPAAISADYQLVISIEGAFFWICPQKEESQSLPLPPPLPKRIKHVFLSSSVTIPFSGSSLSSPVGRTVSIQSILQDGLRKSKTLLRRTDLSRSRREAARGSRRHNAKGSRGNEFKKTFHSFAFPLPAVDDCEIPGTISVSRVHQSGLRGRWYAEGEQVAYKLTAHLQPVSPENAPEVEEYIVESPIFIDSEPKVDELGHLSGAWSESPLMCSEPLAFHCVLFLPQPASFARTDSIPFSLFFTTSPNSDTLARKIMRNANIRITLMRQLHLDSGLAISAPVPRSRSSDDGPSPGTKEAKRRGRGRGGSLLRRVTTSTPALFGWPRRARAKGKVDIHGSTSGDKAQGHAAPSREKPLPALPLESLKLYEDAVCSMTSEGFKKRVSRKDMHSLQRRSLMGSTRSSVKAVPDGVFKGELQLRNELSNTIDWPGLSLSYFVEATVRFGDDVLQTRHVVRVVEPYPE